MGLQQSLWAHREYIASKSLWLVRVDGEQERRIDFQWDSSKSLWDSSKVYGLIENTLPAKVYGRQRGSGKVDRARFSLVCNSLPSTVHFINKNRVFRPLRGLVLRSGPSKPAYLVITKIRNRMV